MRGRSSRPRAWSRLPEGPIKSQRPHEAGVGLGVVRSGSSGLRVLPGEPRDVRTGNADIGQFAVVEVRKFPHRSAVALPGVEEVDYRQKHYGILSSFVVESQLDIGAACCAAKWNWCSAAKWNLHVSGNNFSRIGSPMVDFGDFSRIFRSPVMLIAQCCPRRCFGGLFSADQWPG